MRLYTLTRTGLTLAAALVPALVGLSCCCITDPCDDCHGGDHEARASFRTAVSAEGLLSFSLEGLNGDMEITATPDADSVIVWGERSVRSDDEEDAAEQLTLLQVEIKPSASALDVRTRQPSRNDGRTFTVNYHVLIPERLRVSATGLNGGFSLSGTAGPVAVNWTNGDVLCASVRGGCEVSLVNGRIDCDGALPATGVFILTSVNGNVNLSVPDTTSAQIDARTTNGTVTVSGLSVRDLSSSRTAVSGVIGGGRGTIRLITVNGNVTLAGE